MTRNEILFSAMGKIKEDYIAEAGIELEKVSAPKSKEKRDKRKSWPKWVALAACLSLFVFVGFKIFSSGTQQGSINLPLLTIPELTSSAGFEGYLAYGPEDLANGNPWTTDISLASLPVFRNRAPVDRAGMPLSGVSGQVLLDQAEDIAAQMGLSIINSYIEYIADKQGEADAGAGDTAFRILAECEGMTIEVEHGGTVVIWLDPSVDLPQPLVFTNASSQEEAEAALGYLIAEFSSLFGMREPSPDLSIDYDIFGSRRVSYHVYEKGGDPKDRILAYSFDKAVFAPDEDGKLWIIRRYLYDLSDAMGDYPIITADEAEKLLFEDHYITTYPAGLPVGAHVSKVELIYRTSRIDEFFIPYYRFLVELPALQEENGLRTYGAFYVPAVKQEYISYLPLWEGTFN